MIQFIKQRFTLLDDSEIIKLALSELYSKIVSENKFDLDDNRHPYYENLTPEEEKGVKKSNADLKADRVAIT